MSKLTLDRAVSAAIGSAIASIVTGLCLKMSLAVMGLVFVTGFAISLVVLSMLFKK